ncbi:MAG: hypothetical protein AB1750_18475 [Chloroflexota bacterium]
MNPKPPPPTYDPANYAALTLADLALFAMSRLQTQGQDLDAEEIVAACFQMFPRRFALQKYPHWPDSAMVTRRWSDLRAKGLLARHGLRLTARGLRRAARVEKMIGPPIRSASRVSEETRTSAHRYTRAVELSDAFGHFKRQGRKARLNEFDFRSMLLCTMESPAATLKRNLEQFKEQVQADGRKDLLALLEFCEAKFSHLLVEAPSRILKR